MDHKSEGFEAWVQALPIEELEAEYREASSNYGNSTDSESREYFGDLRHELATELEHRDYLAKQPKKKWASSIQ